MATAKYPQPEGRPLLGPKIDVVDAAMSELDFAITRARMDRIVSLSKRSALILYKELAQLRFNALQSVAEHANGTKENDE